jgi:predicted DNA-binding transcriptional regulator AlpA
MPSTIAPAPPTPPDCLITKREFARRLAVSIRTLDYRACTDPRFPPKVRTSLRMVRFRESDVNRYIAQL